ncbi:unnamed protein product [Pseudo-nitzschia multistriata]|uniref:Uncharacterized protein n=1 Tax=Pseudo-nitzschia multistriata TaxID=183589 RepID=A0A448Z522_9STRA|nr:unnamed protein product [Pseudo-nitzschia multistriata]
MYNHTIPTEYPITPARTCQFVMSPNSSERYTIRSRKQCFPMRDDTKNREHKSLDNSGYTMIWMKEFEHPNAYMTFATFTNKLIDDINRNINAWIGSSSSDSSDNGLLFRGTKVSCRSD